VLNPHGPLLSPVLPVSAVTISLCGSVSGEERVSHPPTASCFFLAPAGGVIWFALLKLKGYVSLASLISLWCLPGIAAALSFPAPFLALLTALAALSTTRHRDNIRRLFEGKESSFKK
jgi:glycerol-3-phosphate acyltransferase PlsY